MLNYVTRVSFHINMHRRLRNSISAFEFVLALCSCQKNKQGMATTNAYFHLHLEARISFIMMEWTYVQNYKVAFEMRFLHILWCTPIYSSWVKLTMGSISYVCKTCEVFVWSYNMLFTSSEWYAL